MAILEISLIVGILSSAAGFSYFISKARYEISLKKEILSERKS